MKYKQLNVITGWIVFAIAAITYLLTMEPTASFWDCGEFITTAFKQEVGHPPGAPLFMIIGRFFTLFGGGGTGAAVMMNVISVLASAFTIVFLFWTITHLTKRLINKEDNLTLAQTIIILGSGMVGALAYTFSDTFWFSAVEAEVYATSSFFTAIVVWAILKWENVADKPYANRWIILIAYLFGLSIGVHLLNLLAIPALGLVYYYRKYEFTKKGMIWALVISTLILGVINYGIIPGVVKVASWFELFFVNTLGLPFNTGVAVYLLLLIGAIVYGVWYTHKKGKVIWNTAIVAFMAVLIGYSCYAIIPIRSAAKLPMDQNSPDDVFSLLSYLNREQYGDRPLFYGQYYSTPLDRRERYIDDKKEYIQKDGKYVVSNVRQVPNYDDEFCSFFPRMWSKSDPRHEKAYLQWGKIKGQKKRVTGANGQAQTVIKPTFSENLRFFFNYQVKFMYWRYFMWNFAGRQNDIQGHGEAVHGNWISGIPFIDNARLGNQSLLPEKYKNKANNKYYLLPFLLGLIGIYFQYKSGKQGKKDLWIVASLYILTGLAIVVYLNQYPYQPRERDYAYAGSFYAFTIWIGLGVAGIYSLLKKAQNNTAVAGGITALALLAVPVLMASENWDDHDRSGRYTARDFGHNYLTSCESQGVIFTNGDNDTYPLWYNQEVEEFGTDIRVCNLSYFQTDWYVSQMQRKAYESEPLPISFEFEEYVQGTRDAIWILEDPRLKGKPIELGRALSFIKDDSPGSKLTQADNASYFPTRDLYIKVDKEAVRKANFLSEKEMTQVVDTMHIHLSGDYVTKDELMILDMLYHNNWERPIYYAISVGNSKYLSLNKYFRLEGMTYRIVPIETKGNSDVTGYVATDIMYNNLMNEFKWGNLAGEGVYLDENNRRMCLNLRSNFYRLADALYKEGDKERCIEVLDRCVETLPAEKIPFDYFGVQIARLYYQVGEKEKGEELTSLIADNAISESDYMLSLKPKQLQSVTETLQRPLFILYQLTRISNQYSEEDLKDKIRTSFEDFNKRYGAAMN